MPRNITENLNRLSKAHERYRQTDDKRQTDGRAIAYSERERQFTFAKKTTSTTDHRAIPSLVHWIIGTLYRDRWTDTFGTVKSGLGG